MIELDADIHIKIPKSEVLDIKHYAKLEGRTLSSFCRIAALEKVNKLKKKEAKIS